MFIQLSYFGQVQHKNIPVPLWAMSYGNPPGRRDGKD